MFLNETAIESFIVIVIILPEKVFVAFGHFSNAALFSFTLFKSLNETVFR